MTTARTSTIWSVALVSAAALGIGIGSALGNVGARQTGPLMKATSEPSESAASPSATSEGTDASSLDTRTLALLRSIARQDADRLGISNPPDVQPVQVVPSSVSDDTQIACLNEAGIAAVKGDGSDGISYPPQEDLTNTALNLAIYTCDVKYPTITN